MKLFDDLTRTDSNYQGRTEQDFDFLNRSADPRFEVIRAGIESWFTKLPEEFKEDIEKKVHLRERFRGDDGPHSGALLELITHELLSAVGNNVLVDPDLNGLTPDFEATIGGMRVLLECTVVHPSDQKVSSDKREARIKKTLDSMYIGQFALGTEFVEHGGGQPSIKLLMRNIKEWIDTLDPGEGIVSHYDWNFEGWRVIISALPLKHGVSKEEGDRAIGVEIKADIVDADDRIQRALKKKASKYKESKLPYVIVISHRFDHVSLLSNSIYNNSVIDALYGPIRWVSHTRDLSDLHEERQFDGFFGSSEKPKSDRISAVLFKRQLTVTNPSIPGFTPDQMPPWTVYHHPWAKDPLPPGLFPFAADVNLSSVIERDVVTHTLVDIVATRTLTKLLGLPYISKDKFPLAGGMWEAIVG